MMLQSVIAVAVAKRKDWPLKQWSRAHGRHAHRMIVPPQKVEPLREAFARPDRTVLIRESGDGDKTPLNLGDAVAKITYNAL